MSFHPLHDKNLLSAGKHLTSHMERSLNTLTFMNMMPFGDGPKAYLSAWANPSMDEAMSITHPTTREQGGVLPSFMNNTNDPAVMVSFRQGMYRVISNNVGVRASHIISEVADTAGTSAIGGDHEEKREEEAARTKTARRSSEGWEGNFTKRIFFIQCLVSI